MYLMIGSICLAERRLYGFSNALLDSRNENLYFTCIDSFINILNTKHKNKFISLLLSFEKYSKTIYNRSHYF